MMGQCLFIAGSHFRSEIASQQVHLIEKIRTSNLGTVAGRPKARGYTSVSKILYVLTLLEPTEVVFLDIFLHSGSERLVLAMITKNVMMWEDSDRQLTVPSTIAEVSADSLEARLCSNSKFKGHSYFLLSLVGARLRNYMIFWSHHYLWLCMPT